MYANNRLKWLGILQLFLLSACTSTTPADRPVSVVAGVSTLNPEEMVHSHNQVRAMLGLSDLTWSPYLASYAQEWADSLAQNYGCHLKHRQELGQDREAFGENLYWASALIWSDGNREPSLVSSSEVAQAWADEQRDYRYGRNTCRRGKQCGHYTQMVWRTTLQIGCGMAYCPNASQIWVCNYDPPGNWVGERPY